MTTDYEKLKQDESTKSSKLQELMSVYKKRPYYYNSDEFLDNFSLHNNDDMNLMKIHKNIMNSNTKINQKQLFNANECIQCNNYNCSNNNKSIMSSILCAIPTFHFHLLLSLTMVLLTHRCPQFLLVL